MRGALILALGALLLPARPARDVPDVVHARIVQALPPVRVPVGIALDGRPVGRAVAVIDGPRLHVAVRDPVGAPVAIVRSDGGQLGVEVLGWREIVASDASTALAGMSGLAPEDLGRLLLGAVPRRVGVPTSLPGGWRARGDGVDLWLDRDGRLQRGLVGGLAVERSASGLSVSDGVQRLELRVGPSEPVEPPESAFLVGRAEVPVVGAERAGLAVFRRLSAGVSGR